jgi:NADPH:quinone reductase-like Zn-dependent oxidoreductase
VTEENLALWLTRRGGGLTIGAAPRSAAGPGEVVVRVRAVAVNPIDAMPPIAYPFVLPWLRFRAVLGTDVAGEVVEVGPGVTTFAPGDRVLGHAVGLEKSRNRPAEGAFQRYVVLMAHLVAPIPDSLSFSQAAVLPLTLSTASVGLFQQDQLGLTLPAVGAPARDETVLVWGGSTSVGSNAIQLARNAGYRVVATASPHNFDYVRSLGADAVADRSSSTVVDELVGLIGTSFLAGTVAIGAGSIAPCMKVTARVAGANRVASSMPSPLSKLQAALVRAPGVRVSYIWGGTLKDNEIGPAVYGFLGEALAAGSYRAEPAATIVGDGLGAIPSAIEQLRKGVSAAKLVVTV